MNRNYLAVLAGAVMSSLATTAWASHQAEALPQDMTVIDIAGYDVPVVEGGLYDRYRSNPPLSVIQEERPDLDLGWFESLKREKVNVGFETYSPNFYYETTRATAIFTADLDRLKELMPTEVLEQVQPIQIWPGRGLIAFTGYAYHYCDNDSYNEVSIAIVTTKPDGANLGPISLMQQSGSDQYWGYVLKLPVDTELARVRGIVGYNLPKWLTGISYIETADRITFEVIDEETGAPDVTFEGRKLENLSGEPKLVTNSFTNLDQDGKLTRGHSVSRDLSYGSSRKGADVELQVREGRLSTFIKSLDLGKMMQYEYVPNFQSALYAPEPMTTYLTRD